MRNLVRLRAAAAGIALPVFAGCGGHVVEGVDAGERHDAFVFETADDADWALDTSFCNRRDGSIELWPRTRVFYFDSALPPNAIRRTFQATLRCEGSTHDVTAATTFSTVPDLGSFSGSTFVSVADVAGTTPVRIVNGVITARYLWWSGESKVTLVRMRRAGPDRDPLFVQSLLIVVPSDDGLRLVPTSGGNLRVRVVDDPESPRPANEVVTTIRAMGEGDASHGCAPIATKDSDGDGREDAFVGAGAGAPLCVRVESKPSSAPVEVTTLSSARIELVNDAGAIVAVRTVYAIVQS